jgi:pSer/pThr/pTyr-binding forkhead associated (FHA) protein
MVWKADFCRLNPSLDCDLLLPDDKSISRRHATIVIFPLSNIKLTNERQKIVIFDSSKFGTFVNQYLPHFLFKKHPLTEDINSKKQPNFHFFGRERLCKGKEKELKEGDVIEFGLNGTQFKLQHLPTVFCFSNMHHENQKSLEISIKNIGNVTKS